MQIHIHRHRVHEISCDGIMTIYGQRICDTAENTGGRIPAGTYSVMLKYSKVHHRKVPVLVNENEAEAENENCVLRRVAGYHETENEKKAAQRSLPRAPCLCMGNGIYNSSDGRIILGTYIAPGCVKCSREPFLLLYDRINNSQRRGNKVTLTITE